MYKGKIYKDYKIRVDTEGTEQKWVILWEKDIHTELKFRILAVHTSLKLDKLPHTKYFRQKKMPEEILSLQVLQNGICAYTLLGIKCYY